MYTSIKKMPLSLLTIICLFTAGITEAKVKTVTGRLMLVATLDGKPAFRPVTWQLTPSSNNNSISPGKTLKRHTITVDLEPDTYRISVSMGRKTLTRQITIKESTKHFLKVSLD